MAAQTFRLGFQRKVAPYIQIGFGITEAGGNASNLDYGFVTDMTSVSYPLVYLELHTENKDMRHLLSGVAIIAALAIPTLASAQRMGPGPYAYTGTGPGVTPPGGFGPSSPLYNQPAGSPSAPNAAPSGSGPTWATTPPAPGSMPPPVYPQAR